jgi:hypothetical protein
MADIKRSVVLANPHLGTYPVKLPLRPQKTSVCLHGVCLAVFSDGDRQ